MSVRGRCIDDSGTGSATATVTKQAEMGVRGCISRPAAKASQSPKWLISLLALHHRHVMIDDKSAESSLLPRRIGGCKKGPPGTLRFSFYGHYGEKGAASKVLGVASVPGCHAGVLMRRQSSPISRAEQGPSQVIAVWARTPRVSRAYRHSNPCIAIYSQHGHHKKRNRSPRDVAQIAGRASDEWPLFVLVAVSCAFWLSGYMD